MASVEVVSHKESVLRATEKALKKAARMIGGSMSGHAVEGCPVDTGLLKNSITFALGGEAPAITDYTSDDKGDGRGVTEGHYDGQAPADDDGEITVYVGTNVEYAPYQELGTSRMDARPFLRPAFENNRDEIRQIIEECCKEIN